MMEKGGLGRPLTNRVKVVIILEELGVPYDLKQVEEVKKEPFTKLNPNGRYGLIDIPSLAQCLMTNLFPSVPAIEDPNTGIVLWESGAIIEYLIDQYDTSSLLTFPSSPEKYHARQWLFFQTTGQGPYFGQAAWFTHSHPDKIPSAIQRYRNEIERVTMVLNTALEGKQYLVGEKCSYADLSFVSWINAIPYLFGDEKPPDFTEKYPHYHAWLQRLLARPAVKRALHPAKEA